MVAYMGILLALLSQLYYGLRVSALYNSLWYLDEARAGRFSDGHERWFARSPLPLYLIRGAGLLWLLPLRGWGGTPWAGLVLAVGSVLCLGLGLGGRAFWCPRLPAGLFAAFVAALLLQVGWGRGFSLEVLAGLMTLFLGYLALCYATRRALTAPTPCLHSRLLEPLGSVLGVGIALSVGWPVLASLRFADFQRAYTPALLATLVILVWLAYRAFFGVRYWLACHTHVTLAAEGATLRATVRLFGLRCLVRCWEAGQVRGLALWLYACATPRFRGWHPRLQVTRSELVLILANGDTRPLTYAEGLLYQSSREYAPLKCWGHPGLHAQGQALAQALTLPWTVLPAACTIMPGDDVPGHGAPPPPPLLKRLPLR